MAHKSDPTLESVPAVYWSRISIATRTSGQSPFLTLSLRGIIAPLFLERNFSQRFYGGCGCVWLGKEYAMTCSMLGSPGYRSLRNKNPEKMLVTVQTLLTVCAKVINQLLLFLKAEFLTC